jgi:hypothetical protein
MLQAKCWWARYGEGMFVQAGILELRQSSQKLELNRRKNDTRRGFEGHAR